MDSKTTTSTMVSIWADVAKPKLKKNVSFGSLAELSFTVEKQKGENKHEMAYPMTLGVCVSETSFTVEDYEQERAAHRSRGNDLKVKLDERRLIIKASKKLAEEFNKAHGRDGFGGGGRHKRRNSIGNGEINRWGQLADFFSSSSSPSSSSASTKNKSKSLNDLDNSAAGGAAAAVTAAASFSALGHPFLRRQNSIGNGEISRLSSKAKSSGTARKDKDIRSSFTKMLKKRISGLQQSSSSLSDQDG